MRMVSTINWESFATTVSAIVVGLALIFGLFSRLLLRTMKQQAADTMEPALDRLEETMRKGFSEVAQGMAKTNERVARLEGETSNRRRRKDDI